MPSTCSVSPRASWTKATRPQGPRVADTGTCGQVAFVQEAPGDTIQALGIEAYT
jgi:hypothetical protein